MAADFEQYPKEVDGTLIMGELTETTGWLPEGPWTPPSEEELRVMKKCERIARAHMVGTLYELGTTKPALGYDAQPIAL